MRRFDPCPECFGRLLTDEYRAMLADTEAIAALPPHELHGELLLAVGTTVEHAIAHEIQTGVAPA